ncbi:MAG: Amuc_1100 family pilus-like protein [Lentisphaeria bacterium]|nr:Amuc_1100 family pilus-like protein [Lentisphaeria bacterium]
MDFIKKKPLMTLSLVIAVLAAAFLAVKIKSASDSARKSGEDIERLKKFGEQEARATYSATEGNLTRSAENLEKTQQRLRELRTALYEASHVEFNGQVSNTQCKNHLFEETGKLVEGLAREAVFVTESAKYLSFHDVINADKLPDEVVEVPVLMKQFEIIREVVSLMKKAQITQLVSLKRPSGVGVAEKGEFQVIPLSMQVTGSSSSVKDLLTRLQKDSKYYFMIRNVSLQSSPVTIGDGGKLAALSAPAAVPKSGVTTPGEENTPDIDLAYAEQFQVQFLDRVSADIRFDFVEFKKPVEEN